MREIPQIEAIQMPEHDFPVRILINDMKEQVHPHWHEEMEILLVLSGEAQQQINDRSFIIRKSDLVILHSNCIHSTKKAGNINADILVLQFHPSILKTMHFLEKDAVINFINGLSCPEPVNTREIPGTYLYDSLINIRNAYKHSGNILKFRVLSELLEIAGICLEHYNTEGVGGNRIPAKTKDSLIRIFDYIDENYSVDITLKDAANVSLYSVPQFARLFKRYTGMTFANYLSSYRISKVCEKIAGSGNNLTISEAAYMSGFSSIATFHRNFRKYQKCTPTEYVYRRN